MIYVYPKLSGVDLHIFRIRGHGLGNLLFTWARAYLLAIKYGFELILPTWRNISLGPILRWEQDKRTYSGLFHHRPFLKFCRDLGIKLNARSYYNENDAISCIPDNSIIVVEGMRENFKDISANRGAIKEEMLRISVKIPTRASPFIAVHIRLGDFIKNSESYARNRRIDIAWYESEIYRALDIYGGNDVRIFTDEISNTEVQSLRSIGDFVKIVRPVNAIHAMLDMSNARHIICSNSTFSLWSAYLSDATLSVKSKELLMDYGLYDMKYDLLV